MSAAGPQQGLDPTVSTSIINGNSPAPSKRSCRSMTPAATFTSILFALLALSTSGTSGRVLAAKQERRRPKRLPIVTDEDPVDPEAALRFGHHLLRTHSDDRANALSQFPTLASESGFPAGETLFLLGRAHDEGREDIGIKRDEAVARELYESAAKLGHPGSQHALSVLLASSAEGGGEVEAILYDFFASLGGDTLAHAALGYRYLHG